MDSMLYKLIGILAGKGKSSQLETEKKPLGQSVPLEHESDLVTVIRKDTVVPIIFHTHPLSLGYVDLGQIPSDDVNAMVITFFTLLHWP